MERKNRKSINDDLTKYCILADKDSFIEVTQWTNEEGVDILIDNGKRSINVSLTYGELKAINFLTKCLDYYDNI